MYEAKSKMHRNKKAYFKNNGGVTFSGGEPLLHSKLLIELCKKLKKEHRRVKLIFIFLEAEKFVL